ncbi:MFS general substrate transporter [Patellaria atrata CBS 101060]|uniref:MFS general substrate transporter n=1 Tax=Patellaria atrata CBS 101060 TaxID=1346257 RepID=A0A9P4SJ10_9PEZI|nr:MFS general substrate transporter [Patellaria atrata CBS 101060]
MGLGILEDTKLQHVPGTVRFGERNTQQDDVVIEGPDLKYDRSGSHAIILVPQPSDNPNDPLNWPLWKRDLILLTLSLLAVIASTLSPILAANTFTLSLYFHRTFTDMALLTGWHLLAVGIAGFIFVPSARVWGKRHCYIIGTVVLIFSSAWGGASGTNYKSLLGARIFQGIGLAPFEALVNASVGDLYFVHQRGKRMALTNLALFGGAFFTPVLVGKITDTIGWEWTFYFVAIFSAAFLPVVLLFVPETAFRRDSKLNTDIATTDDGGFRGHELTSTNLENRTTATSKEPISHSQNGSSDEHRLHTTPPPPISHSRLKPTLKVRLSPFNGRKADEPYWKLLLRPFPLFFHPSILWACLIQGTLIGWTVMIGIVLAAIVIAPPLFFSEVETGYLYAGAFIGALVGFAIAGISADWIAVRCTRWNGGIYEPEFRMWLVLPQLVLGCAGLYGFGITSDKTGKYGWIWPDFFFGMEVAGMVVGAVASALYIVDAHRDIAVEAFTCLIVFKNIFSFGLTWSAYDWLIETGIRKPFIAVASVQVAICCLTIPMYIFGKKNRSFFARHDIFKTLGLR